MSIKKLAFCAISIAIAAAAGMFRIFTLPFGGEITFFSMLFIVLPAWFYGVRYGVLCGLVYGLILFAINPYIISIPQFILDYILAFSVMGVAGIFCRKTQVSLGDSSSDLTQDSTNKSDCSLLKGYLAAIVARWVIATLAGLMWVAAGSKAWDGWAPLPYSMAYNGAYIFAEGIVTAVIISTPPVRKGLEYVRKQALG